MTLLLGTPDPVFVMAPDGVRIATYDVGPQHASTVLAVHGFASSAQANWYSTGWVRELLRAGFRVLAVDQRGHGRSDKPHSSDAYSTDRMVEDIHAVLDSYLLDEVGIVGYSLGARVAWHAALGSEHRITRAVLGGIPDGRPLTRFRVAEARAFSQHGTNVDDRLTAAYIQLAARTEDNDLDALIALVEGLQEGLQPDPTEPPSQPVLFATGSEDGILPASRRLAEATPNGRFFEIPGRNHFNAPTARTFRDEAIAFLTTSLEDLTVPVTDRSTTTQPVVAPRQRREATPDRNLALELVRATEAAAIRAVPFIGKGDKLAADGAAVDAMRAFLSTVHFAGVVVIGEGEKDRAPMLFNGEHVGDGEGPEADVAVDPIDGTSMTAQGRQNALSMIAVADRGSMLDASSVFYMEKLVTDRHGAGVVSLDRSVEDNIRELAKAKGKPIGELIIAVLDRPRHAHLIEQIRAAGAGTRLLLDGDVAGGINAARSDTRIDMCIGIGGSPEAIVTACAIKALDGFIEARFAPTDEAEATRGTSAGLDVHRIYDADALVASDNTIFVATGVTDGGLVDGVRRHGPVLQTESIVLRSRSGTVRRIRSEHLASRWL